MSSQYKTEYKEIEVSNVVDILSMLKQYPDSLFFRGQSNYEWNLIPKIARPYIDNKPTDTWDRIESFILSDFKKYSIPYLKREPRNQFEWLVTGQHYGLPTRLLDWSSNPLKATYFAVCDNIDTDSALFALSPTSMIPMLDDDEEIDPKYFHTIYPNMIDTRVIVQEACFTSFPLPNESEKFNNLEDTVFYEGYYFMLLKMKIFSKNKPAILHELDLLGINQRTLFPDLSGLSDYLYWKFLNDHYC